MHNAINDIMDAQYYSRVPIIMNGIALIAILHVNLLRDRASPIGGVSVALARSGAKCPERCQIRRS